MFDFVLWALGLLVSPLQGAVAIGQRAELHSVSAIGYHSNHNNQTLSMVLWTFVCVCSKRLSEKQRRKETVLTAK
eukprot:2985698-Amphidinium_carterae.1